MSPEVPVVCQYCRKAEGDLILSRAVHTAVCLLCLEAMTWARWGGLIVAEAIMWCWRCSEREATHRVRPDGVVSWVCEWCLSELIRSHVWGQA